MTDQELSAYCEEWMNWCYTRRFYVPMGSPSLLARMQPSKTGLPPNARNSADMQYFNMAIHAMADMPEYKEAFSCFKICYMEQPDCLKRKIDELRISRGTYYNRTRAFVRKAYSMARSLKAATEKMKEPDLIDVD